MSDYYNTDEAVARVAKRLVDDDEVAALVDDLYCASTMLTKLLSGANPPPFAQSIKDHLSRIQRMVHEEGDRIVREGYESRAEGLEWQRELARDRAA